ncbi:MAG: B12-binding domain-containing radical SAM protein, partial [Elusimicrobia bacterium]|nr:B12-binding domain-containing radical SAM protein [Elusimicrobiota bacterium]
MNLQIIAGALERDGHEVKIFDSQSLTPLHKDFISALESFEPDIVGFSNSEIPNTGVVVSVASTLRKKYPQIKFMAGGQIPTFKSELFLGPGKPFDVIVLYEAEATVGPIVKALLNGSSFEDAPGAAWLGDDGKIRYSKKHEGLSGLDDFAFPSWKEPFKKASFSKGLAATFETTRGCSYHCSFCSIPAFYGEKPRYKSVKRILEELKILKSLNVTEVYFIDDSFATKTEAARELFEGMIREKLNMNFLIQIRADIIYSNPDIIELCAKAGMFMAVVGFEGYTSKVQEGTVKGNSDKINIEASKLLRKLCIAVFGTHVFGAPTSGWKDNWLTFIKGRKNSDIFRMTIFTPLPGSKIYFELLKKQCLNSDMPEDFYEGKYLIKDNHNPWLMQMAYFGLLALHYACPGTVFKTLF